MKVLVLTSSTGGGHDARADAFRSWILNLYGASVEVRIDHALEKSSRSYAFGVELYNVIQRRAPFLHHVYYNMGEVFGYFQRHNIQVGKNYFHALLHEFQPDVILSVHSILNRGFFRYAKSTLSKPVFCVTYCGEFAGGYGFSRNWVAPEVDLFAGRTDQTLRAANALGMPEHKGRSLGHLLKPSFYEQPLSAGEKAAYLRYQLGLQPGKFTVLLASGGAGAQNHIALLRQLLPFADRLQVIALCGSTERVLRRLHTWGREHPELGLALLSFSQEMHRLLQAASVVVVRPGTTTSAEALQLGCPIVFNCMGGIMPQELCTLRYFRARSLAPKVWRPSGLKRVVGAWIDNPDQFTRYRASFRRAKTPDEPKALIQAILGRDISDLGSAESPWVRGSTGTRYRAEGGRSGWPREDTGT